MSSLKRLWELRWWWLLPAALVWLLYAALVVLSGPSPRAAFVYTLF